MDERDNKKNNQINMNNQIKKIAKEHLGLETLEARNSDSLDFKEQGVWQIKKALEEAYQSGYRNGRDAKRKPSLEDLIWIGRKFNDMGWSIQDQLESVINDPSPKNIAEQNGNALEYVKEFLNDSAGMIEDEGEAYNLIESIEEAEKAMDELEDEE